MQTTPQDLQVLSEPSPALLEALSRGRLLVFAGSGLSKPAPSCLPDWQGFTEAVLEGIKQLALTAGLPAEARAAIEGLELAHIPTEAFSDLVVRAFAGVSYFPVLEVLDSDQTNENHRALAELARRGVLRAVVTTNFDTLIERAFAEMGVAHAVLVTPEDYQRSPQPPAVCTIYKIHGTVTDSTTLIDTVTQKLRGLARPVLARLAELFRDHHVLVVGFSGADLNFGEDYLAFSAVREDGPGLTWAVRPSVSKLSPRVEESIRRAGRGGSVLRADAPALFQHFGVPVKVDGGKPPREEQEEALGRAREKIRAFVGWTGNHPLAAVAFCLSLLFHTRRRDAFMAVRKALAELVRALGEALPYEALGACEILSYIALDEGDTDEGLSWVNLMLKRGSSVMTNPKAHGLTPTATLIQKWNTAAVSVLCNLSRHFLLQYGPGAAHAPLQEAERAAEASGDPEVRSVVLMQEALVAGAEGKDAEVLLEMYEAAYVLAQETGYAEQLGYCGMLMAQLLGGLGEYDCALGVLEQVEEKLRLGGSLRMQAQRTIFRATIMARRGQWEEAYAGFLRGIEQLQGDRLSVAQHWVGMVDLFQFHRPLRERLVEQLDQILDDMRAGRIPSDGRAGLPPQASLKEDRDALAAGRVLDVPSFTRPTNSSHEARLRACIQQLEFEVKRQELPARLLELCDLQFSQQRPQRMLDAAWAAQVAAERVGDALARVKSLERAGIALAGLRQMDRAQAAFEELLASQPPPPPELRASAQRNLGLLRVHRNELEEAEALLRSARALDEGAGRFREAAEDVFQLARVLASRGELDAALEELDGAEVLRQKAKDPSLTGSWLLLKIDLKRARVERGREAAAVAATPDEGAGSPAP